MSIFLALLHHPVLNRHGDLSTTAVTNVDMHDISRAARTYGVKRFFVVTPIELQRELCKRVVRHWTDGSGGRRNHNRSQAFELVEVMKDLEATTLRVEELAGAPPVVVVTGAQLLEDTMPFEMASEHFRTLDRPVLLLLGTGWGLHPTVIQQADIRLPAIVGPEGVQGYNHLSVRSAASIIMDRLLGKCE